MATPHGNSFRAADRPSAAQEVYLLLYRRCIIHHLRVLDFEISQLENATSCSALLNELLTISHSSSGSGLLLDEISRARAKRDRIYQELEQNQQRLQDLRNSYICCQRSWFS